MNTKKSLGVLLSALAILLLMVTPALAASPHFINASASIDGSGNLVVSWKEAGLGNDALISYVASAHATVDYGCINGGGNHPKASNKFTVDGPVTGSGTFSSGQNGDITGSLTLNPPSAGSFTCPSGQTLVLADVTYTGISLMDTTNGITAGISGTLSKTFYTFK